MNQRLLTGERQGGRSLPTNRRFKRYNALKLAGWSSFAMGIPAIAIGYLGGYVDDSPSK